MASSGYALFREQGGASNDEVKAWEAANPGKNYTQTTGNLTWREWIQRAHLGATNTANDQSVIQNHRANTGYIGSNGQFVNTSKPLTDISTTNQPDYSGLNSSSRPGSNPSGDRVSPTKTTDRRTIDNGQVNLTKTGNQQTIDHGAGSTYRPTSGSNTNYNRPIDNGTGIGNNTTNNGNSGSYTPPTKNTGSNTGNQSTNTPATGAWNESPSVAAHLNGLLSSDSQYLQTARQNAQEAASARGLLNSSIAAGAGERVAIEAAMPIAQQDAGFRQDAAMAHFNSQLASQRSAQDVTANTHGSYLQAIEEITKQANISINEIETATNISAEDKTTMIQNTIDRRDADLAWTRQLYSNMPTWDMSWINLDSMPDAPGVV